MKCGLATADVMKFMAPYGPGQEPTLDLVFGSPPYALKVGRYAGMDKGAMPPSEPYEWAAWMLKATRASAQACKGYVIWIVDSPRKKVKGGGVYVPAVEILTTMIYEDKDLVLKTPILWTKNGAPGGPYYPGHCWEKAIVCHWKGRKPFYDEAAISTVAKFDSGPGRQRRDDGRRTPSKRGKKAGTPARPKDVIYVTVGGGHMGMVKPDGKIDHADSAMSTGKGEAPFPWKLAHWFVRGFSPKGGRVADPFLGTGTTGSASAALDRDFYGCDIRRDQVEAAKVRIKHTYAVYHPDSPPLQIV